ncbi:MAG: tRNA (adenosine(37)-N6)-threonylcarbamoyltransferase complex ATPase subunit type 1 TsaE [Salibacteraceae bacterium]
MKSKVWISRSVEDLAEIAIDFTNYFSAEKVILFVGKMGAGKTTFIKNLCSAWGVKDDVSSPTFSLVNEYLIGNDEKIFHFDFYRIEEEVEAFDIGFEEYIESGNRCLIEWPDRVEGLLPDDFLLVTIKEADGERTIEVKTIQ